MTVRDDWAVIPLDEFTMRPFGARDAEELFAYTQQEAYSRYLSYSAPSTLEEAVSFLESVLVPPNETHLLWAIEPKGTDAASGTVMLTRNSGATAELHYEIADWLRGQGWVPQAAGRAIEAMAVVWPEVTTLRANTHFQNLASQRVLAKLGFGEIGRRREKWESFDEPVQVID